VRYRDLKQMEIFPEEETDLPKVEFKTEGEKWAWLAGIIDGEGHLGVSYRSSGGADIFLKIEMKNLPIVRFLQSQLAGSIWEDKRQGREGYCTYTLSGKKLFLVLKRVLPYLIVKRRDAELLIEAWENRDRFERLETIRRELQELHPKKTEAGKKGLEAKLVKYGLNRRGFKQMKGGRNERLLKKLEDLKNGDIYQNDVLMCDFWARFGLFYLLFDLRHS